MIHFKAVRYKNFLSSGNQWTSIDLCDHPQTLIVGANGAGKSTLLDAVCFALFNKPFRKFNKSDVVNSINGKDAVVELIFMKGNDVYLLRRGVAPSTFEIVLNNKKLEVSGAKDNQAVLESVLGFNFKTFTQVAILGSSSFVPFMKLVAADRRAIIEDLLDIRVFSVMNTIIKARQSLLKNEYAVAEANLNQTKGKLDTLQRAYKAAQADNASYLLKLQAEIDMCETTIRVNRAALQELNQKTLAKNDLMKKSKELQTLSYQISSKWKGLVDQSNFLHENDNCATCKQPITEDFKNSIIEANKPKVGDMVMAMAALNDRVGVIQTALNEIDEVERTMQTHRALVSMNESMIEQSKKRQVSIQKKMTDSNLLTDSITAAEEDIVHGDMEVGHIRAKSAMNEVALTMLKDTGIKALIIKQYLPVINKVVNENLKAMDFFVAIEFDEQFNESIKSRHRDKFTYEHFSEGERMRIDLALLLTWRAVAKLKSRMDTNLLILDEVFDSSLDEAGVDGFMSILNSWESRNVFIISHKGDQLADKFQNIIKFEKQQGFSVIV